VVAAAIAMTVVAAIAWNLNRSGTWPAVSPATPAPTSATRAPLLQSSVAVLPFANFSGSQEDYFADAMQDAVIGELARVKDLRVISRTSTLPFSKSGKSAGEIARALNTENLLEGSVTHAGDRIRVQVKLIRAGADERPVWSEVYEREARDVFALYGEIAGAVAMQVDSRLAPAVKAARRGTARQVDPEIYKLYLRGVYQLHKGGEEGFTNGIKLLREALEKDPGDPLPYAGLALAYATRAHDRLGTPEDLELARAAANKAVQIDPNVADAYAGLALINLYDDWDWASAQKNFERALALNPSLAETRRHYAWLLVTQRRFDEAFAQQSRARDDDPLDGVKQSDVGWTELLMGRVDAALKDTRKGVELAPENAAVYQPLGNVYLKKGMFREALETHRKMVKMSPEYEGLLARTLILAGRKEEAQPIMDRLKKDPSSDAAYCLAIAYAALGDKDETLRWATAMRDRRFIWTPWLGTFEELAGMRGDPRFQKLLASLKLK
jgi:TolB-like protein/Tfp pilus assembly protein PilF